MLIDIWEEGVCVRVCVCVCVRAHVTVCVCMCVSMSVSVCYISGVATLGPTGVLALYHQPL